MSILLTIKYASINYYYLYLLNITFERTMFITYVLQKKFSLRHSLQTTCGHRLCAKSRPELYDGSSKTVLDVVEELKLLYQDKQRFNLLFKI